MDEIRLQKNKIVRSIDIKKKCIYSVRYKLINDKIYDGYMYVQRESLSKGNEYISYLNVVTSTVKRQIGSFEIISTTRYINVQNIMEYKLVTEPLPSPKFVVGQHIGCMKYRLHNVYSADHIILANSFVTGIITSIKKSSVVIRIHTEEEDLILEFLGTRPECFELD